MAGGDGAWCDCGGGAGAAGVEELAGAGCSGAASAGTGPAGAALVGAPSVGVPGAGDSVGDGGNGCRSTPKPATASPGASVPCAGSVGASPVRDASSGGANCNHGGVAGIIADGCPLFSCVIASPCKVIPGDMGPPARRDGRHHAGECTHGCRIVNGERHAEQRSGSGAVTTGRRKRPVTARGLRRLRGYPQTSRANRTPHVICGIISTPSAEVIGNGRKSSGRVGTLTAPAASNQDIAHQRRRGRRCGTGSNRRGEEGQ